MAKSGTMKWVLIVVACFALIAMQRQNAKKTERFQDSVELQFEDNNRVSDDVYTSIPPRDENTNEYSSGNSDAVTSELLLEQATESVSVPFLRSSDGFEGEISDEIIEQEIESSLDSDWPLVQTPASQLPKPEFSSSEQDQPVASSNVRQRISLSQGVQMKVVRHIEYGKSLARRGAVFGAKNEFRNALRLVAQAMDYQYETDEYSESLYKAMVAIDEADDFYFAQARNNGKVDVEAIGSRHSSKILSVEELRTINSVDAMQAYYNFVQNELAKCGGKTVVAGEALFCLGKLYLLKSRDAVEGSPLDNAKSIVHHRAALECDARNYKSANELAVLLFKSGRLEQAKKLLVHSLKVKQVPAAWENLARIHQQMGEGRLASLAMSEYERMMSNPPSTNRIQWVAPDQFAAGSQREPVELRTANANASAPANSKPKQSSKIKNVINKLF